MNLIMESWKATCFVEAGRKQTQQDEISRLLWRISREEDPGGDA
jgi:hypothetical protein